MNTWSQILFKAMLKKGIEANVKRSDQTRKSPLSVKNALHELLEAIIK